MYVEMQNGGIIEADFFKQDSYVPTSLIANFKGSNVRMPIGFYDSEAEAMIALGFMRDDVRGGALPRCISAKAAKEEWKNRCGTKEVTNE